MRRALGISPDAIVTAHLGRYHPIKDHHTYLQAATQLARVEPRTRFILAGRGVVPDNSALLDAIPRDLRDRFSLLGERDDVSTILAASDIFVLSSLAEAFPNALGEAMAAACACVATEVGEVPDLLARCGSIVPPGSRACWERQCSDTVRIPRCDGWMAGRRGSESVAITRWMRRYRAIRRSTKAPQRDNG
jgi:glycosyltransferase involved in cell wall biosynthesis